MSRTIEKIPGLAYRVGMKRTLLKRRERELRLERQKRAKDMIRRVRTGEPLSAIARDYGVTRQRVQQIVKAGMGGA